MQYKSKNLKRLSYTYAMMIVTMIGILANKDIWLHRLYPHGDRPACPKIFPVDSLNYTATFCYRSLETALQFPGTTSSLPFMNISMEKLFILPLLLSKH